MSNIKHIPARTDFPYAMITGVADATTGLLTHWRVAVIWDKARDPFWMGVHARMLDAEGEAVRFNALSMAGRLDSLTQFQRTQIAALKRERKDRADRQKKRQQAKLEHAKKRMEDK